MTWNHLIKGVLITIIGTTLTFAHIGAINFIRNLERYSPDWQLFWGIVIFILVGLWIIVLMFIGFFIKDLCDNWAEGYWDDILNKPIFKTKQKVNLLTTLNEHLKEAQQRNDQEEIFRLKQSIEIHKR